MCPLRGALEQPRVEWDWEQFSQTVRARLTSKIRQQHFEVTAEFPENLAAGTARRRRLVRIGHNRDATELRVPVGQRLEHRDAFGTDRQAVCRILDVATCDDSPVRGLQRGANLEAGKSSLRIPACLPRRGD